MCAAGPKHQLDPVIRSLPDKPGIYQYFDKTGTLIYVGKAKKLKRRVASYFNRDHSHSGKVRVMVKQITEIRFMVVDTEMDALLLENNLIKKYQPKYNVLLKDDKTYPWICIKQEPFPRIFPTRNLVKDGSLYFGPYASVKMMHTLLDLIRHLYPLRSCAHFLSEQNIQKGKFKVCLEYHLGNCLGPCEGLQTEADYRETIQAIKSIIKGNIHTVTQQLKNLMQELAVKMEFEKAQKVKEKILLLESYQSKSTIVNPSINNVDVFSIVTDEKNAFINFLKVVNGAIIQGHTIELRKKLEESDEELLTLALTELRQRYDSQAREIILPFDVAIEFPNIQKTIPQRGDKKKLLELSERNAKYYRLEKRKQKDLVDPERHSRRILAQMKKDLRMPVEPKHIECFDNSNLQGAYPVAAMVCFKNARPAKKEYRHYNIKTVEGPDDFASMEEVIYRRYKRLLDEQKPLPDLVVVDGGKGQLSAALSGLEQLGLRGKITIIGIAKRLEELYFPGDSLPLYLDKTSETLKIIQQLRDEAHRFGITHHRKKREKGTIKTELTEIEGIGPATAELLLKTFRSVKKIKEAPLEQLQTTIGNAKGEIVFRHFEKQQNK